MEETDQEKQILSKVLDMVSTATEYTLSTYILGFSIQFGLLAIHFTIGGAVVYYRHERILTIEGEDIRETLLLQASAAQSRIDATRRSSTVAEFLALPTEET